MCTELETCGGGDGIIGSNEERTKKAMAGKYVNKSRANMTSIQFLDWRQTSLRKYVDVFEKFLQPMEGKWLKIKRETSVAEGKRFF